MQTKADQVWRAVISLSRVSGTFTAEEVQTSIGEDAPTNRTVRNRLNGMVELGFLISEGGNGAEPKRFSPTSALTGNNIPKDSNGEEARSFPYPGGKTSLAQWVQAQLPPHKCYVEPFAGSAAVLIGKARSQIEVLNDMDDMLIRVFRTVQQEPDRLEGRLSSIPFSRSIHDDWKTHLDTGEWPDDDVEATARWFTLRYTQHSAKLTASSGFKTSKKTNPARAFQNAKRVLPALSDRLEGVILESDDWMNIAERYDGEETVFYFDPPYAEGKGDELYRHNGTFSHERLATWLTDCESQWLVSYEKIPDVFNLEDYTVLEQDTTYSIAAREGEDRQEATERLICNFNPKDTERFVSSDMQQGKLDV